MMYLKLAVLCVIGAGFCLAIAHARLAARVLELEKHRGKHDK